MVHPGSNRVPRVPLYSGTHSPLLSISHTGLSPSMAVFPKTLLLSIKDRLYCAPYNPLPTEVNRVWAVPVSLTATQGISFDFFSSGYGDVSAPPVCSPFGVPALSGWVPPFGHLRIEAWLTAPRKLIAVDLRPSSPLNAKASSRCALSNLIFQKK